MLLISLAPFTPHLTLGDRIALEQIEQIEQIEHAASSGPILSDFDKRLCGNAKSFMQSPDHL
jgi:hypothetical protein